MGLAVQHEKKIFDTRLLKRVFRFAAPYKKKFYGSVMLSVLLALLAPVRPLLIQLTINEGIAGKRAAAFLEGPGGFIIEITIIQLLLLLIETVTRFYFTYSTASLGQSVVKDMRNSTYEKILQLNLRQFDQTPIGTLTTRTINDIESVNDIFSDGLIPIIADLLSIISVLTYMFWADWKLTLVCLAPFRS
jgi:ATP-binding cassette subfamily B protein